MSSNMRQLLTGTAALLAVLILGVPLWTGTSVAQSEHPGALDAGQPPAVIAGTMEPSAGMQGGMVVTVTAMCPGCRKMRGSVIGQEMMRPHMMMGHGMMRHRMMQMVQMMHQGGMATDMSAAAAGTDTVAAAGTGAAETMVPAGFAAALEEADATRGQQLTLSYGCIGCHPLDNSMLMVGPTWHNLKETAAGRVPGQEAAEYLYTSMVRPNAYVVPGYLPSVMVQSYGQQLGEQELVDMVKYLLTLE
jgi:cytochrome c551/c552